MRKVFRAFKLSLLTLILTATMHAQEQSGTYTTFADGRPVVTENYTVRRDAQGSVRAEADIGAIAAGQPRQRAVTIIRNNRPVEFSVEASGATLLSAHFSANSVRLNIAGQAARTVTSEATAISENNVWHHYIFLLAQYDAARGGAQNIKAFLPSQATTFDARIERTGTTEYTANNRRASAERWRITATGGLVIDVWTDEARVPLVISIESQTVRVVRTGAESLDEAIRRAAQTATADARFRSEEVTFRNGGVTLAGTLTKPRDATNSQSGARLPGVILISGSGGQNRDGNPGSFNLLRLIAETLSPAGFVVLRHDDRGIGGSTMPNAPTTYRDLINDTRAGVEYLRTRPDVDPDFIVVIGHSEGAETAGIIAAEDARIAAIALLAGVSRPLTEGVSEQLLYQAALQRPTTVAEAEQGTPEFVRRFLQQIADARTGRRDATVSDVYEYLREHAANNPSAIIRRVRCPVLILQGERDLLVLAYHAVEIARALTDAGNTRAQVRIFPNLGHSFTPSPLDPANVNSESASRVSPEVLDTLKTWLEGVHRARPNTLSVD